MKKQDAKIMDQESYRLIRNARARAAYAKKNAHKPKVVTAAMESREAMAKGLVKFTSSIPCHQCGCTQRYARKKPQCVDCMKAKNKRYEEKYPEKFKAMKADWYQKNKEYCAAYQKARYQLAKEQKQNGN